MREITLNNTLLEIYVLERKPLFDTNGNIVGSSDHRTTLYPDSVEQAAEMGSEVEKAFHFFMTDEVKAEYQRRLEAAKQAEIARLEEEKARQEAETKAE